MDHHTIWLHHNQASHALKQGKTNELLLLFPSHVSYVSWVCCIALANHVSLKWVTCLKRKLHMLHLGVAHYSFHKHTWNISTCCNVSKTCFTHYKLMHEWMMLKFMKCKCNYGSQTPRVLHKGPPNAMLTYAILLSSASFAKPNRRPWRICPWHYGYSTCASLLNI
jgi:hypothetical protein